MARWIISTAILLFVHANCNFATAESSPSSGDGVVNATASEVERGSPQFIYMEQLRRKLKHIESGVTTPGEDSHVGGTLLATSIEADRSLGLTEYGFAFEGGNVLRMYFTVPKQRDVNTIQKAEMWLFPDTRNVEPHSVLHVYLAVIASLPHASNPRREALMYPWNTDQGCISLDVTALTKKIARNLHKQNLDSANVSVRIEVLRAVPRPAVQSTSLDADGLPYAFQSICTALQTRVRETPFLVVKYYSEEIARENADELAPTRQKKEESALPNPGNCSLTSLFVNFTEVYGPFVMAPLQEDIKDCQGGCHTSNFRSYSSHAFAKERLSWIDGGQTQATISCVPVELDPLELLIYQEGYFLIVEFPDMVAKKCGCR